ncbi:hypothetical protein MY5147_004473 [Beauveria neobassiana]
MSLSEADRTAHLEEAQTKGRVSDNALIAEIAALGQERHGLENALAQAPSSAAGPNTLAADQWPLYIAEANTTSMQTVGKDEYMRYWIFRDLSA